MADSGSSGQPAGRLTRMLERVSPPLRDSGDPREAYDPDRHGPLVDHESLDGDELLAQYWVDEPYAMVSIEATHGRGRRYRVLTPPLDPPITALLDRLRGDLRDRLINTTDDGVDPERDALETALVRTIRAADLLVDPVAFETIRYHLDRRFRGFGRLDPPLRDPAVEDLSCDGYDLPLFVDHREYGTLETNLRFDEAALDDAVRTLAQRSGRAISIGEPIAAVRLPGGSRGELVLGDSITPRGSAFTIRQYTTDPLTPVQLAERGTYSSDQLAVLWLAIEHGRSLVVAGGTAAGKTTTLNALSMLLPPTAKVVSIEDTPELRLAHDNWLALVTREGRGEDTSIDMYDLLRSALRHRPEYLVVGEVRGREAVTLFQAMNTGHTTFSTVHAASVRTAVSRLENEPIGVPRAMLRTLDLVVLQAIVSVDGAPVRRGTTIAELRGVDERSGALEYVELSRWDPARDTFEMATDQSRLLTEIRRERGWTREDLHHQLDERRRVLETARAADVVGYQRFSAILDAYRSDPDALFDRLEDGPTVRMPRSS